MTIRVRCAECVHAELRGVQIDGEPDEAELYCTEWADQVGAWEYCSRGRRKGETE